MSLVSSRLSVVCVRYATRFGIGHVNDFNLFRRSHDLRHQWRFAQRANDFVVIAMANQDQRIAFLGELHRLHVNLGDQRTGRINDAQLALLAVLADLGRNAVRAVNHALAVGHLVHAVDKNRALAVAVPRPQSGCGRSPCARRSAAQRSPAQCGQYRWPAPLRRRSHAASAKVRSFRQSSLEFQPRFKPLLRSPAPAARLLSRAMRSEGTALVLDAKTTTKSLPSGYTIPIVAILINYRKVPGWST